MLKIKTRGNAVTSEKHKINEIPATESAKEVETNKSSSLPNEEHRNREGATRAALSWELCSRKNELHMRT